MCNCNPGDLSCEQDDCAQSIVRTQILSTPGQQVGFSNVRDVNENYTRLYENKRKKTSNEKFDILQFFLNLKYLP